MVPVVVVIFVVVAIGLIGALAYFAVGLVVRHVSRTREQASIVFAIQMALFAMVQASLQRCDSATYNGQYVGGGKTDPQWASADKRARATLVSHVGLLQDNQLRNLVDQLLDRTLELVRATNAGEVARIRTDVESLHEGFRARSVEVVRTLGLRDI